MPSPVEENEVLTPELVIETSNAPLIHEDAARELIATLAPLRGRVDACRSLSRVVVKDQKTALEAKALRDQIAKERKLVEEAIAAHKEAAFSRHRLWSRFENWFLDPLKDAYKMISAELDKYDTEQRRIAEEVRRKAQAEADEKARREREAQEMAAAKQRAIEEEARRKAEEARRKAEQASEAERKRLLEEADKAEREANRAAAKAEVREERAATVIAPTINVEAQTSGKRSQKRWTAKVTDQAAFMQAAAKDPTLQGFVVIETAKLARSKAANVMFAAPGVEFTQETV